MIGNLIGCLFVLFILFGLLCNLTGDENKGTQIINNCVTAIVIYAMIIVSGFGRPVSYEFCSVVC